MHWERIGPEDAVAGVLFCIAAVAMFVFAKRSHRGAHVVVALGIGAVFGAMGGIIWVTWMDLDTPLSVNAVARVWEEGKWSEGSRERWLAVCVIAGMALSWLSLRLIAPNTDVRRKD